MRRVKILLTDGSSPSALQALHALGRRYVIDVCDPRPVLCPARYSRFVRRTFRCPCFGVNPISYTEFLVRRLKAERYDVLLPVHDQTYVISRFRKELEPLARVPVPDFAAVEQIHDKDKLAKLMADLGLVYRAPASDKPLCAAQAVFQHGRLLALHASQVRARGAAGIIARSAVHHPAVHDDLVRLGARLQWHGALSLEYAIDPSTGQPSYGAAHPRLGETANATANGVNLAEWLVQVGLDQATLPPSRALARSSKTHNLLASMLATARATGSRKQVLKELWHALNEDGIYANSHDELTRPADHFLGIVPAAATMIRLLLRPRSADKLIDANADSYVLSEKTIQVISKLSGKLL